MNNINLTKNKIIKRKEKKFNKKREFLIVIYNHISMFFNKIF